MSNFKELSPYKNYIMEKLVSNNILINLIYYAIANPLEQETVLTPEELIYTNIFPYRFIPDTNSNASTYIAMKYGKFFPSEGKAFKDGYITLYIMTHKTLIRTDYGALRYDMILEQIDEMFNGSKGDWIGKMEFAEMEEVQFNDSYYGVYVTYKITNFNNRK